MVAPSGGIWLLLISLKFTEEKRYWAWGKHRGWTGTWYKGFRVLISSGLSRYFAKNNSWQLIQCFFNRW